MQQDISVYVVEAYDDIRELAAAGIYDFSHDLDECVNCGMVVALLSALDRVIPCVIIVGIADGEAWPVCLDCASPLLYPQDWLPEF